MVSEGEGRLEITIFVARDVGIKLEDMSCLWTPLVKRDQLYITMRELGIPNKLINLLKMTLNSTESKVRVEGGDSQAFLIGN